jgi:hypothetical protein
VSGDVVRAFLEAADGLLAAQECLMPEPAPEKLRRLTEAHIVARGALMYEASYCHRSKTFHRNAVIINPQYQR